jgi:hypothetical protein
MNKYGFSFKMYNSGTRFLKKSKKEARNPLTEFGKKELRSIFQVSDELIHSPSCGVLRPRVYYMTLREERECAGNA